LAILRSFTAPFREKTASNSQLSNPAKLFRGLWWWTDYGLKDCTYTELASWLTGIGYPTTADDVKNAKRSKAALTDWPLVKDAKVKALLDAIGVRYGWPKV
jgi:hypothetical protein